MNTFSCSLVYTWMTIREGHFYVIDSLFWEVSLTRSLSLRLSSESHLYTVYYCMSLYVILCTKYTNKICLNQEVLWLYFSKSE